MGISKHAPGTIVDFYRPEREAEVLRLALERNRNGTLRDEEILRLFREIMSACLAQEKPLKVAYLGPEGTYSQQAVLKHFGHSVRALSLASIDEVFQEVQAGNADFGVVPVENSTEGTVNNTLDRFLTTSLHICGEVELRVHHNLMGAHEGSCRGAARLRASAGAGRSAAAGWTSTCRAPSACRSAAMPKARAAPATRQGTRGDRRRRRRRGLRPRPSWRTTSRTTPTTPRASW